MSGIPVSESPALDFGAGLGLRGPNPASEKAIPDRSTIAVRYAPDVRSLDASTLAALVHDAGPAIHADGFTQARWLLEAGFLVAAAATARAELERRLLGALRARGEMGADVVHDSIRDVLTAALCAGIIEPSTGSAIDALDRRLSEFARGRHADPAELAACLDELDAASATLVGDDEPAGD